MLETVPAEGLRSPGRQARLRCDDGRVMGAGSVLRGVRAGVFAAVCVLLASLGHVLMSGTPVPAGVLFLAWAGVSWGGWCLAGSERGPVFVGALTVGTQASLHGVFSLGQVAESGPGGSAAGHHVASGAGTGPVSGHVHGAGAGMTDSAGGTAGAMVHGGMNGSVSGMIAAHVLVALLSAWWLWCGERAAFRLLRSASARLFAPLTIVSGAVLPVPAPVVRMDGPERRRGPRQLFLSHVIWLRGPPSVSAVR